jgi:mono/diheme cytochrome c family protein
MRFPSGGWRVSFVIWPAALALAVGLAIGCGEDSVSTPIRHSTATDDTGDDGGVSTGTGPFGDTEALGYLQRECAACHGIDANGSPAVNASQWAMPKELSRAWLESTVDTADVYQTLLLASQKKTTGFPVAMPPAALNDEGKRAEVDRMLQWMRITQPLAVLDANEVYGNPSDKKIPEISYVCTKNATLRRFLANFTAAAYERAPTVAELSALPAGDLDADVKADARKAIVAQLDDEAHKQEFIDHGLKRLAIAIGGAPNIAPGGAITPAIAKELEEEFYSLVSDRWATAKYRSLFHDDTVMVSASTAPLYGCDPPPGSGDADAGAPAEIQRVPCVMSAPRHGFFSTLGFLNSKQSSFLITNNNYGRVAFLYFTLFGGVPRAATSGPSGSTAAALPSCLEATDSRSLVGAAFGTHAIPEVGAFCQGCHLYKGLAAGSILFRPFSTRGLIYDPAAVGAGQSGPGDEDFILKNALLADRKLEDGSLTKVNADFLSSLASGAMNAPASCLPTSDPNNPYATFKHVGELTDFLLGRSVSLATGFTRHAHRAFANSSTPSAEMILRVYSALEKDGTLRDLAMAYFNSDSFACDGAQ